MSTCEWIEFTLAFMWFLAMYLVGMWHTANYIRDWAAHKVNAHYVKAQNKHLQSYVGQNMNDVMNKLKKLKIHHRVMSYDGLENIEDTCTEGCVSIHVVDEIVTKIWIET